MYTVVALDCLPDAWAGYRAGAVVYVAICACAAVAYYVTLLAANPWVRTVLLAIAPLMAIFAAVHGYGLTSALGSPRTTVDDCRLPPFIDASRCFGIDTSYASGGVEYFVAEGTLRPDWTTSFVPRPSEPDSCHDGMHDDCCSFDGAGFERASCEAIGRPDLRQCYRCIGPEYNGGRDYGALGVSGERAFVFHGWKLPPDAWPAFRASVHAKVWRSLTRDF